MHEEQVLRMALACIRWNQYGECRTDGWPGLPPTAADTAAALEASLAKPQPVGGAAHPADFIAAQDREIASQIASDALRMADMFADGWTPFLAEDTRRVVEVLRALATLSAPVAQPAASEPLTDEAIIAIRNATWDGPVQPWGSALRFARGIEAALAAPAQAAAVPEAVERDAAREKALHKAIEHPTAYETAAFRKGWRAALSQGDVSGEGEGAPMPTSIAQIAEWKRKADLWDEGVA